MTIKEAASILSFIKGLPAYCCDYGPDYRKANYHQINNFIELLKIQVDNVNERKELDKFKEKV